MKKPTVTKTSGNAKVLGNAKVNGKSYDICFFPKKPAKKQAQPKSLRISFELRQPLLQKYLSRKQMRELHCGGKLSHNLIIAEIIAEVLDPLDPSSD